MVDLAVPRKCRAGTTRTDPPSVISALIQLTTAMLAQMLLELAALHVVIR
jgi:hypothetical protein